MKAWFEGKVVQGRTTIYPSENFLIFLLKGTCKISFKAKKY
jgi:hypothetical protein